MSLRSLAILLVLVVALVAYLAWNRNTQHATAPSLGTVQPGEVAEPSHAPSAGSGAQPAPPMAASPGEEASTDPGLAWQVPTRWTNKGPGTMRLATYAIPGHNSDDAQCAVYYFGQGGGGGVDPNIERWRGEFKGAADEKRGSFQTKGGKVTMLSMNGTYLAHAGMMGGGADDVESPHWGLLGAIVEGPKGEVYFKLTGPEKTVHGAEREFESMLKSITPH